MRSLEGGVSREGLLTGEHLVEDRPQVEEVRARIGRFAPELLRRHVSDRAEDRPGLGFELRAACGAVRQRAVQAMGGPVRRAAPA